LELVKSCFFGFTISSLTDILTCEIPIGFSAIDLNGSPRFVSGGFTGPSILETECRGAFLFHLQCGKSYLLDRDLSGVPTPSSQVRRLLGAFFLAVSPNALSLNKNGGFTYLRSLVPCVRWWGAKWVGHACPPIIPYPTRSLPSLAF
jgi:hypothetical protein